MYSLPAIPALRTYIRKFPHSNPFGQFNGFADTLLANDEQRKSFNVYENTISSLYEACKPEVLGRKLGRVVSAFQYLRGVMDSIVTPASL